MKGKFPSKIKFITFDFKQLHSTIVEQLQARADFLPANTAAYRLLDGPSDGLDKGSCLEVYANDKIKAWLWQTQETPTSLEIKHFTKVAQQHKVSLYLKVLGAKNLSKSPQHICGAEITKPFLVTESGRSYWIDFASGYSQGIFLDQRDNRNKVADLVKEQLAHQAEVKVLNTFAYTAGFSISAALAGATTTTLDLSNTYLEWSKRNFEANELALSEHYFLKGDTLEWLPKFAKKQRLFDGIILDPPSFSRNKGKVFKVQDHYRALIEQALACLAPKGWVLCSTNYLGFNAQQFKSMAKKACHQQGLRANLSAAQLPQDFASSNHLKVIFIQAL